MLRTGKRETADIEHIAEEIESLARQERRELINRLAALLAQLLRWQHQPDARGSLIRLTIEAQRVRLNHCFDDSPSLVAEMDRAMAKAYRVALVEAERETGMSRQTFPAACPFTVAHVFDDNSSRTEAAGWLPWWSVAQSPRRRQRAVLETEHRCAVARHPGALWAVADIYDRFVRWRRNGLIDRLFKRLHLRLDEPPRVSRQLYSNGFRRLVIDARRDHRVEGNRTTAAGRSAGVSPKGAPAHRPGHDRA